MSSNGYVRRKCMWCIFFSGFDRELGYRCMLYSEDYSKMDYMRYVSANDCDKNPLMKEKYYEEFEHYFYLNEERLRNLVRQKFGIKKID